MKKKILVIISIFFWSGVVFSQNERYLTFEAGGAGGLGSFNFEKSFYQKSSVNLIFRAGISGLPFGSKGVVLIFPIMVHAVIGQNNHKLDVGIGQAPSATVPLTGIFIRMPLSFGYKYEPKNKNHYWRAAYTPLVSYLVQFQWEHWAGVTFGYKLKAKKK